MAQEDGKDHILSVMSGRANNRPIFPESRRWPEVKSRGFRYGFSGKRLGRTAESGLFAEAAYKTASTASLALVGLWNK
jgi:hypothetical protein